MTPLRPALAVALVATGLAVMANAAAAAAPTTVALVMQDLVIPPSGTASFTFTVAGTLPDDTEVVIEAYTKLASPRSDLQQMVAGNLRNRDVGFVATSLNRLTPDAVGRYTMGLPTVTTANERVVGGNALLPDDGMYPITLELRADNVPLAQLATAIVRVDAAASTTTPLDVALVLPVGGAPTLRADGSTVIDTADRTRLHTVASVLAGNATPATLVPRPELVDGLARTGLPADADLRTSLAAAIGARQVLATPFVAMDPTAVVRSGLGDELTKQLTEGEDTISGALGGVVSTDRSTWVVGERIGNDAVTMLRGLGVRRLVVPADALTPTSNGNSAPTTAVTIDGSSSALPVDVAVADPGLARSFDQRDDSVLAAYQFVTELLAIGLEHAAAPGRQGVVVVPPEGWQPDPTFLATVLALVGQSSLLHPVTLDQWFRDVAVTRIPLRSLSEPHPDDLAGYADGLALTRIRLAGLSSMLPAADPQPATLDQQLRVANAENLTTTQRQSYLDAVNAQLDDLRHAVDPVPKRRITLAGKTTELPLTLHRRIDRTIQVRVHLESPKLSFPENDLLVTLDSETVQQRIVVQARANGTFPLTVRIMTPEGDIALAPATELTVQATTLSGFGVVLSVGALLVLATWWVRHLRRSRRRRAVETTTRRRPSVGPPPATLTTP